MLVNAVWSIYYIKTVITDAAYVCVLCEKLLSLIPDTRTPVHEARHKILCSPVYSVQGLCQVCTWIDR